MNTGRPLKRYDPIAHEIGLHEAYTSVTVLSSHPDLPHASNILLPRNRRVIVMGVSGCGKTRIGKALADTFHAIFIDGDDYHPPENIEKMKRGVPLDDNDRAAWLATLARLIQDCKARSQTVFIGCSALKRAYRDQLRGSDAALVFVFLNGTFNDILKRMQARQHFFTPDMLASQFNTLEVPTAEEPVITVDIQGDSADVLHTATRQLNAYFREGNTS